MTSPAYNISDDRAFAGGTTQAGGIQRWDSNGAGGYNYSYPLATGTNSAGAIGLAVYFPPNISVWGTGVSGAILYATTAERPNNRLVSITDNGFGSPAPTLSSSGVKQTFAGIRFGPSTVPVGLYNNPQVTNAFAGQSMTWSVTPTGSAPYYYPGAVNGTNIIGATNAVLTLNNLQSVDAGSYSVTVSNDVDSITSSGGQLIILALPQFTSSINLGNSQGLQVNFTGPASYGYSLWASTNLALKPVTNTWTKLTTGTFSGGGDTFIDPHSGNQSAQCYIITTP